MQNPETITPISPTPDAASTFKGAITLAVILLATPVYLAVFFGFCGLAARAFHYAALQIGF